MRKETLKRDPSKRPLKETYICAKRPIYIYMKRDLRNAVYTHTQQVRERESFAGLFSYIQALFV